MIPTSARSPFLSCGCHGSLRWSRAESMMYRMEGGSRALARVRVIVSQAPIGPIRQARGLIVISPHVGLLRDAFAVGGPINSIFRPTTIFSIIAAWNELIAHPVQFMSIACAIVRAGF